MSEPTWHSLLKQARAAWQDNRHHDALQLCDRAALVSQPARHDAAMLRGDILLDMGDAAGALSSYDSVADPAVRDALLDCARGLALFELARFAEAENALQSALRDNPALPDAHYALGVMAEILGNGQETEHFRKARKLAPDRFGAPPRLSAEDFEACVEEALERLPDRVRTAMQAMPVLVAEVPRVEDLRGAEPTLSPQSLGMHVVLSMGPGGVPEEGGVPRPALLLFKRNIERACPHHTARVRAIRDTVLEEAVAALNLSYGEDLDEWPGMN